MEHPHEDAGFAVLHGPLHINPPNPVGQLSIGIKPDVLMQNGALNAALRIQYFNPNISAKSRLKDYLCSTAPELLDAANMIAGVEGQCGRQMVRIIWEQTPDEANRVALSSTERDRFDIPRPHLFWRKTEQDYRTAKVAFELLGKHLYRSGIGLLRAERYLIEMGGYPENSEIGGNHHIGGTRISETPQEGVVNPNLRVHGMSNCYAAGSSVFVRGGHANPTYTIVQLSLRLAKHLSTQING